MDVAEAIDAEAIPVTHISRVAGDYTDGGRSTATLGDPNGIQAVIQPIGKALMDVDEGKRAEAKWLFWSRTFVEVDDVVITPRGRTIVLQLWDRDGDGFCRAALGLTK